MDFLSVIDDSGHIISISNILTNLYPIRQSKEIKNTFADIICSASVENNLVDYKEVCLKVNGKQSGKLRNGLIKFNKYSKQLAVLFKIYADFESALKGVWINDRSSQENIPCSFGYKNDYIDDRFGKPVVSYRGKNAVTKFTTTLAKDYRYCKGVLK